MSKLVKLHRPKNDRMIGGVMSGIANYYGWSPNMLRFLFVVISTLSAAVPGILIYLILWILMPNANSSSYSNSY